MHQPKVKCTKKQAFAKTYSLMLTFCSVVGLCMSKW